MSEEFKLPDLGEGIHEAEVLTVHVKPGQEVKEDDPIFEVETDKAVVEIPSPHAGKVEEVRVKAGDVVTVGSVMVTFSVGGAIGQKAKSGQTEFEPPKESVASASGGVSKLPENVSPLKPTITEGRPIPASPATRRLARELGVDLRAIHATGIGGRILKEDVRAHVAASLEPMVSNGLTLGDKSSPGSGSNGGANLESPVSLTEKYGGDEKVETSSEPLGTSRNGAPSAPLPDFSKFGKVERVLLRSIRRKTAENMSRSWAHVPHVTHSDEADLTNLEAAKAKLEPEIWKMGGRLTFTTFVLKAVASALKKYPQFNASLDEAKSEIIFKHYYNIGLAVATERGLIVPVIKDVDKKSMVELALEVNELAEKTRSGKIEIERLQGGTFTVSNVGAIGGTGMSPMVNYPEAAILAMGKAEPKPVVRAGQLAVGLVLPLALSFDHRIADGAEAAYFVKHIKTRLEEPITLLLEA